MMIEVQVHGLRFEEWVKRTFFAGYAGNYGQEWDIPATANNSGEIPAELRRLPVSIKTAKYGSPIGLGDALRQRNIDVSFVMIVGFWNQRTPTEKWIEDIGAVKFTVQNWRGFWGALDAKSLQEIDASVKNPDLPYTEARELARNWKKNTAAKSASAIVINPKIDSRNQRRIQCSFPFREFWKCVGRAPVRADNPRLFGQEFPNPIHSPPRNFTRV